MTVKQLIKKLEKLDPKKGIWINYDYGCRIYNPIPDDIATKEYAERHAEYRIKVGDYLINACC